MIKELRVVLVVMFMIIEVFATQQILDKIYFDNTVWNTEFGPTIYEEATRLSETRTDTNQLYPTNLSRGFVATYKIINDSVYISKVVGLDNSIGAEIGGEPGIWAKNYSGVVVASKSVSKGNDSTIIIKVLKGIVSKYYKTQYLSVEDLFYKSSFVDQRLDSMISEYRRYIYFKSNYINSDRIEFENIRGRLVSSSKKSLIDQYFEKNGLKWNYNWERSDTSGVPVVKFQIAEGKIFIDSLYIQTKNDGLIPVGIQNVFGGPFTSNGYIVDWYSGFVGLNYKSKKTINQCGGYKLFDIESGLVKKVYSVSEKLDAESKTEIIKKIAKFRNRQLQLCIEHNLKHKSE